MQVVECLTLFNLSYWHGIDPHIVPNQHALVVMLRDKVAEYVKNEDGVGTAHGLFRALAQRIVHIRTNR